jgi:hypothetical protein
MAQPFAPLTEKLDTVTSFLPIQLPPSHAKTKPPAQNDFLQKPDPD